MAKRTRWTLRDAAATGKAGVLGDDLHSAALTRAVEFPSTRGARIGAKGSPRIAHRLVPFPDADRSKDPPIRDLLGETVAMVLAPTWRSARRS
jgi:hypothetical protein